ncbi:MAG TPA: hypothetical protein VFK85_00315 [Anaeromyxobacteraceae bacterium]|nr:hypothetical protein [Anaeromyxobacteraceae bacterium]
MTPRSDRARTTARTNAVAAAIATIALLLFCWPLVRIPRLTLSQAWLHLFGAWALLIVALFALARAYGGANRARDDRNHHGA